MPLRAPKGFVDETDPKVCQIGHPAPPWLVNYADLMTELVCFFVILYALSAALNKNVQKAAEQIKEMIDKKEIAGNVQIDKEGLHITLNEQGKNVFFQSGSAELTPEMEELMGKLSPVLKGLVGQHEIVVEGHTDRLSIKNDLYQNNWELSTARATNVVEYLIRDKGFPPEKMAAMGYGEFRPIVPNDTPENRSKNRRVVFFIKNSTLAPPKTAAKPGEKPEAAKAAAEAPAPAKPGLFKTWFKSLKRILSKILPKWFNKT